MDIITLDGKKVGTIDLSAAVFGVAVRPDLMQRAVLWQQASMRAGLANTKTRGEINRSKKKMYGQKGTGNARHGAASPSLFRGGGVTFGPRPRDFSTSLPKKVRQLALKSALSSKVIEGTLIIIDEAKLTTPQTKAFMAQLTTLNRGATRLSMAFIIDSLDSNFNLATRNIPHLKVLPTEGANVYDILQHDTLVLTQNAVRLLTNRLEGEDAVADGQPISATKPARQVIKPVEPAVALAVPAKKPVARTKKAAAE